MKNDGRLDEISKGLDKGWAGERNYGEMYAQAIDESDAAYSTLSGYKWVAGEIKFCLRKQKVSWTVHSHVASLPKEKQIEALNKAEEEKWTEREARSKIRIP